MENNGSSKKSAWWWAFPLHTLLSTAGTLILSGVVTFAAVGSARGRWILIETPYYPVQVSVGFAIGIVAFRRLRHRIMEWVWVLPFSILCVYFVSSTLPIGLRLEHFFGWQCRPEQRCLDQLSFTLPFYASASYSLGAFVGKSFVKSKA